MNVRSIIVTVIGLFPASRFKNVALRFLGWAIGRSVDVGPCLILGVDEVQIADGVKIGPFNVFRGLAKLELGKDARIGQWNWLSASLHMRQMGGPGQFHLGAQSALTSRHYVDCTGGIRVGVYTTLAGERSTFLTHGISWVTSDQTFRPINIGDYCLLSSNVQVTPGTTVGDRVVVGMGATIAGTLSEPGLYVQPRAELVKSDLAGQYFERRHGHVDSVRARS